MLKSLYIRDYALIEELEVNFSRGLNIITGETGAGKSILIGGLKLILGERAQTDALRRGARKAVVEGVFDVNDVAAVRDILVEEGFDLSDELILRRELRENKSRAFINDSPASLAQMRRLTDEILDLHGQHEHQSLLKEARHLPMIDAMGDYDDLLRDYGVVFATLGGLQNEWDDLKSREGELKERRELLSFQIGEIEGVNPLPDEQRTLEAERQILENAEHLFSATREVYENLYGSDNSALGAVVKARNELRDLARIDPSFEEPASEIESARISIDEVSKSIDEYSRGIEFNPERLESIRERLGDLDRLCRRYGGSLESVLDYWQKSGEEFTLVSSFEGQIKRIEESIHAERKRLTGLAWRISEERKLVAGEIEILVAEHLTELGMPDARFEIRISQIQDEEGWIGVPDPEGVSANNEKVVNEVHSNRYRARTSGVDQVAFYLSANRGEDLRPLSRVASGGEISRIMLALKSVLARSGGVPVLVFDEIDAGISGSIAFKVSESLQRLAVDHQLIVITHLPQVAARAYSHFRVVKQEINSRVTMAISLLDEDERQIEIATLLSGETVTEAALKSARELIQA